MKITFDGNYGRDGVIRIEQAECHACKTTRLCLYIDNSEGEYTAGVICKDCIDKLFAEVI
jgi:hypothetical protein